MANRTAPTDVAEADRLELRYCPRCGALGIGTKDQRVCIACAGVLRWLYQRRSNSTRRGDRGAQ
jgi:hypothetical protein